MKYQVRSAANNKILQPKWNYKEALKRACCHWRFYFCDLNINNRVTPSWVEGTHVVIIDGCFPQPEKYLTKTSFAGGIENFYPFPTITSAAYMLTDVDQWHDQDVTYY